MSDPQVHDSDCLCVICWNDAVERGDTDRKAKLSNPELLVRIGAKEVLDK